MKRDRHIIQKYLDHDLSDKDMKRFEADLEVSSELQSDLGLYQEIDEALADTEVLSFRDQLSDLRKETKKNKRTGSIPFRLTKPWHYAATAAVALILAIGLASVLDRPLTNKDLLKKYYKPYEVALINRSDNTNVALSLKQAEHFYQLGEFAKAVEYFELVLAVQPDQPDTKLYTGISYYELQRYEEANDNFNKVIEHNDNMYVEPAEWYLGLCFLAMEDNERARRQFARIASSNHEKAEEAEKLLRKIRR
jgi:tetratricopeptide (TPR) repeat protein